MSEGAARSLGEKARRAARRAERALQGLGKLRGHVMIGPPRREVALTFDDGPSAEHTPAILDRLAERGARATFFLLGAHIEAHPEIAARVAREHEVGCHSHAHGRGLVLSLDAFREDTARFRRAVEQYIGSMPKYYRFPWGDPGRIGAHNVLALEGMTCVHWSASSGDDHLEAEEILRRIERGLEPGAIFLLHDGLAPGSVRPRSRALTALVLPRALDIIAARGYRAVTVGELLDPARAR